MIWGKVRVIEEKTCHSFEEEEEEHVSVEVERQVL